MRPKEFASSLLFVAPVLVSFFVCAHYNLTGNYLFSLNWLLCHVVTSPLSPAHITQPFSTRPFRLPEFYMNSVNSPANSQQDSDLSSSTIEKFLLRKAKLAATLHIIFSHFLSGDQTCLPIHNDET